MTRQLASLFMVGLVVNVAVVQRVHRFAPCTCISFFIHVHRFHRSLSPLSTNAFSCSRTFWPTQLRHRLGEWFMARFRPLQLALRQRR